MRMTRATDAEQPRRIRLWRIQDRGV